MARIFTDEVLARIPELIELGLPVTEVANRLGCNLSSLRVICSRRRISLRKGGYRHQINLTMKTEPMTLPDSIARLLTKAADKLNRKPEQLVSDLLERIANDNLFDAVLDEA
jgi:hypothetical protein